ncbi:MAG: ComEC/Rec2 family competence protein, partial [Nocardioides sp.]
LGDVRLQVVGPARVPSLAGVDDGSGPNNASIVLVAEVGGERLLLTGDIEPSAQATLARTVAGLQVDVLKVPHHGSRFQDLAFLTSLGARWAIISVGADNDYGHPSPDTVAALEEAGQEVLRTDQLGDILVLGTADGGVVRARDFE